MGVGASYSVPKCGGSPRRRAAVGSASMSAYDYDLVVIGCGPAGEKGAAQAAYFGKRVAVVETAQPSPAAPASTPARSRRRRCARRRCYLSGLPAARALRHHASTLDREHRRARSSCRARTQCVDARGRAHPLEPRSPRRRRTSAARRSFVDAHTRARRGPAKASARITGEVVLIATGSTPFQPPRSRSTTRTSTTATPSSSIDRMPKPMTVVGAGVIGCEYACMFAALGVKVTLVERARRLLPFLDDEIAERLRAGDGRARHRRAARRELRRARRRATSDAASRPRSTTGDELDVRQVLFAAGRSGSDRGPRARGGRRRGSTSAASRGRRATTGPPCRTIYAAGDVIGFPALASTSMEQARVAVVPRLRLQLQDAGRASPAVRHLHDPRGVLRRRRPRKTRRKKGDRLRRRPRALPRQRARQDHRRQRRRR